MAYTPTPSITFTVNLGIPMTEQIGPNTNAVNPTVLQPDQYQNSPDTGNTQLANRKLTRSTWAQTWIDGFNKFAHHGDTFTLYGTRAIYVRNMYAVGFAPADRAILTYVVN